MKKKGDFGEIGETGSQFVQFLRGFLQESEDPVKQSMNANDSANGDTASKMRLVVLWLVNLESQWEIEKDLKNSNNNDSDSILLKR